MIKIGSQSQIIVEMSDKSYDLSQDNQYSDFLLYITSAESDIFIDKDSFQVDDSIQDDLKEKAERYSQFLVDYCEKRKMKLEELDKVLTWEERKNNVNKFIENLEK